MIIRSVIYDLVDDTEYKNMGIGKCLVRKCIEQYRAPSGWYRRKNISQDFMKKWGLNYMKMWF